MYKFARPFQTAYEIVELINSYKTLSVMGADSNEIDEIKMSTMCEEDEKEKRR